MYWLGTRGHSRVAARGEKRATGPLFASARFTIGC